MDTHAHNSSHDADGQVAPGGQPDLEASTPQASEHRYSDMVNDVRLRSSLRRLFTGSMDEILAELLQNGQRANARTIRITTSAKGFTFADDGHGLAPGLDGFWTLLRIAESYYDNPTIGQQDPMGLGIHALLAHEEVNEVTFTSGDLSLTIQTREWWNTPEYYQSWHERVVQVQEPVQGVHIAVRCTKQLVKKLRESLQAEDTNYGSHQRRWSPFQGYADIFDRIICDNLPVRTSLPRWVRPATILVRTTYQGQELTIGCGWRADDEATRYRYAAATLNWFGQLVSLPTLGLWNYYLNVRSGRPVNPRSPSRLGVIEDSALKALEHFVRDQIFAALADPTNKDSITPSLIQAAYHLDATRAKAELPYVVVTPYARPSEDECSIEGLLQRGERVVHTYADVPFLLRDGLLVPSDVKPHQRLWEQSKVPGPKAPGEDQAPYRGFEYGLDSFIPILEHAGISAYEVVCGDESKLPIHNLFWKPGPPREDAFYHLGEWGLSTIEAGPEEWKPVTGVQTVFAFNDCASSDPYDVDWLVGTTDPQAFLDHEAWYAFAPSEEDDYESQREAYDSNVYAWLRSLIGECIPTAFKTSDIMRQMPTKHSLITHVRFHYPRKKRGIKTTQENRSPIAITARNKAGEKKRLRLVG
jgi:hypothetical protein